MLQPVQIETDLFLQQHLVPIMITRLFPLQLKMTSPSLSRLLDYLFSQGRKQLFENFFPKKI